MVHRLEVPEVPGAQPFFYTWPYFVEKLVNVPVLSVAKVRGRARAQGFEFALACDMRFASREKALFSLVEAAGASIPGGGGIEWLTRLCGRSRTLEIVCSAEDYTADIGELYGFVNRALPDAELDSFVDAFATRIAGFDKNILAACKKPSMRAPTSPLSANCWPRTINCTRWTMHGPNPKAPLERSWRRALVNKGNLNSICPMPSLPCADALGGGEKDEAVYFVRKPAPPWQYAKAG